MFKSAYISQLSFLQSKNASFFKKDLCCLNLGDSYRLNSEDEGKQKRIFKPFQDQLTTRLWIF
jgi:hypothetical protein